MGGHVRLGMIRGMGADWRREHLGFEIARACHRGLGLDALRAEVMKRMQRAVPHVAWCWPTIDPTTQLLTGSHVVGLPPDGADRFFAHELSANDVNLFAPLARSRPPVATLAQQTGGELARSPRWVDLQQPAGLGDELRASLVVDDVLWGGLAMHRRADESPFSAADVAFVASVVSHLADGHRTALLLGTVDAATTTDGPGLLLLDADLRLDAITPPGEHWIADLGGGETWLAQQGFLPSAVYGVVSRLRELDRAPATDGSTAAIEQPRVRVRGKSGRWLAVHASSLAERDGSGRIAVVIEPARPSEIAPIIVAAHRLTERESQVASGVLRGLSTADIAAELAISEHTIQQHLKAIFDKVGVRSRRDLVARIFADHYAPRIAAAQTPGPDGWFAPDPT
jgi:DNA-binding CsgD family transcriptional regulator